MKEDDETEGLSRRGFLTGATAAGIAAVPLTKTSPASAQETQTASAPLPNAADAAMEHEIPEGYSDVQAANYFVHHPGSDFMVAVLKALEFDYLALNPLTGQFGYIAMDGGVGALIPTLSGLFDPTLPGSRVRIRSIPFERDDLEASLKAQYRFNAKTKLTLGYARENADYPFRERSSVEDDVFTVDVQRRGLLGGVLKVDAELRQRGGGGSCVSAMDDNRADSLGVEFPARRYFYRHRTYPRNAQRDDIIYAGLSGSFAMVYPGLW